jgi:hypothetical protein
VENAQRLGRYVADMQQLQEVVCSTGAPVAAVLLPRLAALKQLRKLSVFVRHSRCAFDNKAAALDGLAHALSTCTQVTCLSFSGSTDSEAPCAAGG